MNTTLIRCILDNTQAPFVRAVTDRGMEAFPLLQDLPSDELIEILMDNLQINTEIHKFLALFCAPLEEKPDFMRGLVIGVACTYMAQKDVTKLPMFLHQTMMMVAIMSSKNIDILTGKELDILQKQRFGREN